MSQVKKGRKLIQATKYCNCVSLERNLAAECLCWEKAIVAALGNPATLMSQMVTFVMMPRCMHEGILGRKPRQPLSLFLYHSVQQHAAPIENELLCQTNSKKHFLLGLVLVSFDLA